MWKRRDEPVKPTKTGFGSNCRAKFWRRKHTGQNPVLTKHRVGMRRPCVDETRRRLTAHSADTTHCPSLSILRKALTRRVFLSPFGVLHVPCTSEQQTSTHANTRRQDSTKTKTRREREYVVRSIDLFLTNKNCYVNHSEMHATFRQSR